MASLDTKEQILDAAEELFADRGFDATSLRTITSKAGVNLAAIHYHYGSKEALIEAVLCRRLDDLNRERLELLDEYEATAGDDALELEPLLESFLGPPLRLSADPARRAELFIRLLGHAYTQPGDFLVKLFTTRFGGLVQRYLTAFGRALPELPPEEVVWRFHFMIGIMAHTMAGMHKMGSLGVHVTPASDMDAIIARLVTFVAAGMRATVDVRHQGE